MPADAAMEKNRPTELMKNVRTIWKKRQEKHLVLIFSLAIIFSYNGAQIMLNTIMLPL